MAPKFLASHKRLPRSMKNWAENGATISDYVFWKMMENRWSDLERACVDKEHVKTIVANLGIPVITAKTVDVIALKGLSYREFEQRMAPYLGQRLVAKPTHSAGTIAFLRHAHVGQSLRKLYNAGKQNFFYVNRESQYSRLERKIIIEEDLSSANGGTVPDDFKFHCSHGRVICCQHDTGRFGVPRRRILTAPVFSEMPDDLISPIADPMQKPATWSKMVQLASMISRGFEYVRVDLYTTNGGRIYLGELTFTPGASLGDKNTPQSFRAQPILKTVMSGHPALNAPILLDPKRKGVGNLTVRRGQSQTTEDGESADTVVLH